MPPAEREPDSGATVFGCSFPHQSTRKALNIVEGHLLPECLRAGIGDFDPAGFALDVAASQFYFTALR